MRKPDTTLHPMLRTTWPQRTLPNKFLAIDGRGGSGKSTLALFLSIELGAEIIRTDDFASWDNTLTWWPALIEYVFEPIGRGSTTLSYPRSRWWIDHHPDPVVDQPVTEIMIVEGVTALRREFRPYISYGIFVATPKQICVKRGLARDAGKDGKTDAEIDATWRRWVADEDAYLARDTPEGYADKIVDGTRPYSLQM
jgi:uridine kinase